MSDHLIVMPTPSLVATLVNKERKKGAPLTKKEVLKIRDNTPSKMVTLAEKEAIENRREYEDIDPENVWKEWQDARTELCPLYKTSLSSRILNWGAALGLRDYLVLFGVILLLGSGVLYLFEAWNVKLLAGSLGMLFIAWFMKKEDSTDM